MFSEVAIEVEEVSKVYRIYDQPYHRLMQRFTSSNSGRKWFREFHALRNVTFSVNRGETVGIVGKNGSGKSTLLQLICGTLQPTSGQLTTSGRVAALLELGAGFNPEFTGRENVFLNGAVMGLSKAEVSQRFDSIIEFADIGDFIEQPVKTYSSGMYIRLAFAVAINTTPQILVIDEALSVGDEAFQRKCFARIEELKRNGCTILFVSHSAGSVVQLCNRAILLDAGEMLMSGDPKDVVARYQRLLYAPAAQRHAMREQLLAGMADESHDVVEGSNVSKSEVTETDLSQVERYDANLRAESSVVYASHGAVIRDPHLLNSAGERVNILVPGKEYVYRYTVEFSVEASQVTFGMMIKSVAGVELFGMSSHADGACIATVNDGDRFEVEFRFLSRFLPGTYFTNAGCNGATAAADFGFLHRIVDAMVFKVEMKSTDRGKAGFYDLSAEPACTLVGPSR